MRNRKSRERGFGTVACSAMKKRAGTRAAGSARLEPVAALELMPLTELCNRLEMAQRVSLGRELTGLYRLIGTAINCDSAKNSQLLKLREAFMAFRKGLTAHLREEAGMIFPLIRRLESGAIGKTCTRRLIKISTARMEIQHFKAEEEFAELRALTEEHAALSLASSHARQLRDQLASFEHSLHEQMYEENRFLFSRALAVSRA